MATSYRAKRAQASLEYLLVVGLTFAIMIPTAYLFYAYSKESGQEITDAQITNIGRKIVDTVESIFYSGAGSKTVLELNAPDNMISAFIIDEKELVLTMSSGFGDSELVFFSKIPMTTTGSCTGNVCNIQGLAGTGLKKVKIEALSSGKVKIEVI